METIELSILIALVGCFIGLTGWLTNRDKKLGDDSQWKGVVNTKLDLAIGIRSDVDELEQEVQQQGKKIAVVENSVKATHNRLDEHLRKDDR